MLKKMNKIAAIAVTVGLLGSNTAFAVGSDTEAVVTGQQNVTISGFGAEKFETVDLDGTTQTTTSSLSDITLIDARGTGDGWSVNLKASKFTNGTAKNEILNTLSENSLALGEVTIEAIGDSSPGEEIATLGAGNLDTVSGVNILNAAINEGMGKYTVSVAPMTLTLLPKEAKAGTYTSTVTLTLAQGPQD